MLRLTLSSIKTELEEIRHMDYTQAMNGLEKNATIEEKVLRLQSAYFSSLQTLLPSSLLTPPNTTSTAKYLRTGPPALLDFLRLQYLACITVPYLQAYDMYPKINELDKKKGSTDIREYAKALSLPCIQSPQTTRPNLRNSVPLLLTPLPPPPPNYLLPLLNSSRSYVDSAPLIMYYMESRRYYELLPTAHIRSVKEAVERCGGFNKVIEIGAGDGRMAEGLRGEGMDVVATDDDTWGLTKGSRGVLKMDYVRAMTEIADEDTVVLVSWMPQGVDWTGEIRKAGVKGYVLVGEVFDGCCGHQWETWGNPVHRPKGDEGEGTVFEREGYAMEVVGDGGNQISRYCSEKSRVTRTVLFRRVD